MDFKRCVVLLFSANQICHAVRHYVIIYLIDFHNIGWLFRGVHLSDCFPKCQNGSHSSKLIDLDNLGH